MSKPRRHRSSIYAPRMLDIIRTKGSNWRNQIFQPVLFLSTVAPSPGHTVATSEILSFTASAFSDRP